MKEPKYSQIWPAHTSSFLFYMTIGIITESLMIKLAISGIIRSINGPNLHQMIASMHFITDYNEYTDTLFNDLSSFTLILLISMLGIVMYRCIYIYVQDLKKLRHFRTL